MAPVTIELRDANNDEELGALSHCISILDRFEKNDRARMLAYLCWRFGLQVDALCSRDNPNQ